MNWNIIAIGKPGLAYAQTGIEEYLKRLRPMTRVTMVYLKSSRKEKEGEALLAQSEGMFRIVLDERGRQLTSRDFAKQIGGWEQQSLKSVAILIGGADGHSKATRESADMLCSLSAFTLQHELALVVLLEQLYRAYAINRGLPYHRD